MIKAIFYWLIGKETISTKPAFLRVEISRMCSVNCLYCSQTKEELFYPIDMFKKLVDELKDFLFVTSLYEIGEPLENKDIIDYIKYVKERNIGSLISTGLSIEKDDEFWENLVKSGLDRIIVAIDGISKKVYNKYRRNGNLELVLENLNKILYYRNLHGIDMNIEWQMIDFKWNKLEQEKARVLAKSLGCNEFRIIQNSIIRRQYKKSNFIRKKNCILPYFTFNVTAYNSVRPCPKIYNEEVTIGNLNDNNFQEIWNGLEIRKIRSNKMIQHRTGCKTCKG